MSTPSLVERLRPFVDETIQSLATTQFSVDPIGGALYFKATSIEKRSGFACPIATLA
jgi:hypothetical protein